MNLSEMTGYQFEDLIGQLLKDKGFSVINTGYSNDGGIDLIATCELPFFRGKYIVQCKKWSGAVGQPIIRDLYGVVMSERANKGILITTSHFTTQAIEFSQGKNIELIDGEQLSYLFSLETKPDFPTSAKSIIEGFNYDKYHYLITEIEENPFDDAAYFNLFRFCDQAVKEHGINDGMLDVIDKYLSASQSLQKKVFCKKTNKNKERIALRKAYDLLYLLYRGDIVSSLKIALGYRINVGERPWIYQIGDSGEQTQYHNASELLEIYYSLFEYFHWNWACEFLSRKYQYDFSTAIGKTVFDGINRIDGSCSSNYYSSPILRGILPDKSWSIDISNIIKNITDVHQTETSLKELIKVFE